MRFSPKIGMLVFAVTLLACHPAGRADSRSLRSEKPWKYDDKYDIEEEKFMREFVSLGPRQRFKFWLHNDDVWASFSAAGVRTAVKQKAVLLAKGDVADLLAEFVRASSGRQRIRAVELLCEMDRFVDHRDFSVPAVLGNVQGYSDFQGSIDPFRTVTGRRIGPQGLAVVTWAATQTKDHELRFAAQYYSGFLREEYEKYSTAQLLTAWHSAVASLNPPNYWLEWSMSAASARVLEEVLVERGSEVIVPITRMLIEDRNTTVRAVAINVLNGIDRDVLRLRESNEGRRAIEAVLGALMNRDLAILPNSRDIRQDEWKRQRAQFEQDDFQLYPLSALVLAFAQFYNEKLPLQELPKFMGYLTELNPKFPSWEFIPTGTQDDILHPLFRKKMDRYHDEWKKFSRMKTPPRSLPGEDH